jgi:hypothetical protein
MLCRYKAHSLKICCLITLFTVGALLGVCTSAGPAYASGPKIRTEPGIFDFGYLPEGYKVFHRYWLINDGEDTLNIIEIKPQCGCTTVPLPSDRIAPADSVPLDLSFDSKNIKGVANKLVRIWSNDTTLYPAIIYFTARVAQEAPSVEIAPPAIHLESIDKLKEMIRLENNSDTPCAIDVISPLPDYLSLKIPSDTIPPRSNVELTVAVGDDAPLGRYEASMTLMLTGPNTHAVTIPVRGIGFMR